ncbi:MAG: MFS transporter [Eubacterium sp.]|nr:MFS transporter [Eubacterium sp.]
MKNKILINKKKAIFTIIQTGVLMLVLTAVLTTLSFRKSQTDTYVHTGLLKTVSSVRKLNYALSFGKPLEKYYGLEQLLAEVDSFSEDILAVEVIDQKGNTIETVGKMDESVRQSAALEEYTIKRDGIYAFTGFDAGMMILKLDISRIDKATREYIGYISRLGAFVFCLVLLASILVLMPGAETGVSVNRLRAGGIIILILAQSVLGFQWLYHVDKAYKKSVDSIAKTAARMVEYDLNEVIDKGIYFHELKGIDSYLNNLTDDIPEISRLSIDEETSSDSEMISSYSIIISTDSGKEMTLSCKYDRDQVRAREQKLNNIFDILILILITVFISIEAVNFQTRHEEMKGEIKEGDLYLPGFRMFVFVEGIAFTLDVGFFSVLCAKMFEAMKLPPSLSFLSGMPNTLYSVAVLTGLFGAGSLISRFGMKRVMTGGIIMGILGYILCALSPNLIFLMGARFVYGFCDGIIINSIRLYASSQTDPEKHTRILVEYMAAINLGVSCGVVIGGLVADVTSYTLVFLTGAGLGILCLFLVYFAGFPRQPQKEKKMSFISAVKELRRKEVLIFMVMAVLPVYIATLFVGYTFPLFGSEAGFSNSMVSGCLMLNYIIIAYLTDPISAWVIKRIKPENAMVIYMLLQSISIGIFVLTSRVWAAILALVLTSLWDCFGMVVMDSGLDYVEGTSREKCTMLQMVFGKIGLAIGPVAITARLSAGAAGATGVIVAILLVGLVFYGGFIFYGKRFKPGREGSV